MIKVSVIVPVYNAEPYLEQCINSLVNQTLNDIEVIAVDDGSTDHSFDILKKFEEKYPEMVSVYHKENGGQATARNFGLQVCKGEYIGFLDADDYVETTMLEIMYNSAVETSSDMVECTYHYLEVHKDKMKTLKPYQGIRQFYSQKDMLIDPYVAPWNKLYKASVIQESKVVFPEGFIYEDTAFCIKLVPFIRKSYYIDMPLIYHFKWGTSTMNANKGKRVADIFSVIEDILSFYQRNGFYEQFHLELEYFITKILLCSSLQRIALIQSPTLQHQLIDQTMDVIHKNFSQYKKNTYLGRGAKAFYIKSINKRTIRIYNWVFAYLNRLHLSYVK